MGIFAKDRQNRSHIIQNQKGAALLVVVAIGCIIGSAAYISTSSLRNTQQEQVKVADRNERDRIYNAVKSSFTMHHFCTQALGMKKGVPATAGTKIIPVTLLDQYQITKLYNNYRLKDIKLTTKSTFTDPNDLINFTNFKLEITIEHKDPTLAEQLGSFVSKTYNKLNDKNEEVFFVTTSNKSHCFAHADSIHTFSGLMNNAGKQICNSLGSDAPSPNGTICNIKEFKTKLRDGEEVGIDTTATVNNKSDFQDAFCEFELAALQRTGFHYTSATGKQHYGWTTICRKPRWYGCTKDGNHTPLQTWGDDNVVQTWDTNNGKKKTEVQNAMKKKAQQLSEYTIERRKERVFTHLAYSSLDTSAVQSALWPHFVTGGSDTAALIAATGAFGAEATVAYFGGAFMGPIGFVAFKLILSILGKGCDNTRLRVQYKCVEGYNEVNRVYFDYQKVSWKRLRRRCNWRNASTWIVPTELDIKNAVYNQWLDENGKPREEGALVDALTHTEAKQYRDDLAIVSSIGDLYSPPPPSGEEFELSESSISLPKGLEDVFVKREAELWRAFHNAVSSQLLNLNFIANDFKPHNPMSTKTCAEVVSFLSSAQSTMTSIAAEIQKNIIYANSITSDAAGAGFGKMPPVDIVDQAYNGAGGAISSPARDIRACPDSATCVSPPAGYTTAFVLPPYSISFNIMGYSSLKNLLYETKSNIAAIQSHPDYSTCGASFNPDITISDTAKSF